ncbi:MAG: DUF1501 domain-containing protein [Armatimonadetes bacterium]|nr:DUF1501 domain-containing protein [Armatimonadota bacterium]
MSGLSRRELFRRGGMIAVGMMAPPWLAAVAKADIVRTAQGKRVDKDTVLVVCQLSGGNDGLNTVVPYADAEYLKLRPTIGIKDDDVLKLNESLGLHPNMGGLHELFKEGKVAIIQNVGYPKPNRSHFKSMDIWHSANPGGRTAYGWIGRHFDYLLQDGPISAIAGFGLSVEKPRALNAKHASIPCFASLADIQAMVGNQDAERMLRQIQGADAEAGSAIRTIQQANKTALDAMAELQDKLSQFTPKKEYGNDRFGNGFKQISQIVATSPQTRVVYFSAGGFDTHSKQPEGHGRLMKQFSDAVLAFQREMEAVGRADKVIVLVFSEFGRRSYENGSSGTDHGAAGPMLLIGKNVKGGFHGPNPNLTDLDRGDLKWKIDFRKVYATTLDDWMGSDSGVVLGQDFGSLDLLKA